MIIHLLIIVCTIHLNLQDNLKVHYVGFGKDI